LYLNQIQSPKKAEFKEWKNIIWMKPNSIFKG